MGDLSVLGDIYDLDLALPEYLGARVALITREGTYTYERKIAKVVVNNLEDAIKFFSA